ncbi:hypothetical protein LIER_29573 [Lithospermum erythrorhizon]|uniref:Uncharacterized protein n=1 Tax=Lithospermum erythrorhizon TaxID=34254 RepID=A0AAV3RPS7_LITER
MNTHHFKSFGGFAGGFGLKYTLDWLEQIYSHKRDLDYRKEDNETYERLLENDNKVTHGVLANLKELRKAAGKIESDDDSDDDGGCARNK